MDINTECSVSLFVHFSCLFFYIIVYTADRITRLPRNSTPPEVMRILRENMALKAQIRALVLELKAEKGKHPRLCLTTRAAQVFAFLLTRGDKAFQNYYLSQTGSGMSFLGSAAKAGLKWAS